MQRTPAGRNAVLRWIAIVPTAMACWWATLLFGLALDSLAMRFCPPESVISGFCIADWFHPLEHWIVVGCAGLAGFLIVFVPCVVAPAQRHLVSWAMLLAGLLVAGMMAVQIAAYAECAAAVFGGFGGVFLVAQRLQPRVASA